MALVLNEEEKMLKTSIRELLKEKGAISQLRQLRDERAPLGYSRELWQEMAELGFTSVAIPEAYGGMGFGYTGLGQVMEETGRTLTCSPLLSTVLLSGTAINLGGSEAQKETLLPQIAKGDLIIAFASDETNHHQRSAFKTTATKKGDQYVINGTKTLVFDGHVSNKMIVTATTDSGETGLFIVDNIATGLSVERTFMMDSRNCAVVSFNEVTIDADAMLGNGLNGSNLLEQTLNIATIGLSAEMLGGMQEAFERTVAYLKEREQFGVKIGTFQALQHRAAELFCEIEMCKTIVIKALKAIDEDQNDLAKIASLAKAKCGQVYQRTSNEAIQMFGGIGMTDEEEIGFFLKRARVAQQTFGDTNYHFNRLAKMKNY